MVSSLANIKDLSNLPVHYTCPIGAYFCKHVCAYLLNPIVVVDDYLEDSTALAINTQFLKMPLSPTTDLLVIKSIVNMCICFIVQANQITICKKAQKSCHWQPSVKLWYCIVIFVSLDILLIDIILNFKWHCNFFIDFEEKDIRVFTL